MSYEVTLPVLGESVTEGTVSRWLKRVGESVARDEPLVEISTDKVDTEIPSPVAGVLLEIRVQEDETANVGAVLAVVGDSAEAPAPAAVPAAPAAAPVVPPTLAEVPTTPTMPITSPLPSTPAPEPEAVPSPTGLDIAPSPIEPPATGTHAIAEPISEGPYVTPLVRKLADENGVDLASIQGSGVGGRIRKQDILQAAAPGPEPFPAMQTPVPVPTPPVSFPAPTSPVSVPVPAPTPSISAPSPVPAPPMAQAAPTPPTPGFVVQPSVQPGPHGPEADDKPAPVPVAHSVLAGTTEKISRLRATIARRMVESLQVSAQLTATVEVDLTLVSRLRAQVKQGFLDREGVKLTHLPFIAKATIEALKEYPKVNATIDTEAGEITYPSGEHLGIAVDTPKGLLVPVIKDAGVLSVSGLAKKIADLGTRTRTNQLTPDELVGGTFTISNYGSAGTLFDTPIINQPQVAILGVGAIVRRPVAVSDPSLGEIVAIRDMMYLSLSYDHRLVDGADAARFLASIKARLEEGDFGAEF